jgi:hypothetical protein
VLGGGGDGGVVRDQATGGRGAIDYDLIINELDFVERTNYHFRIKKRENISPGLSLFEIYFYLVSNPYDSFLLIKPAHRFSTLF